MIPHCGWLVVSSLPAIFRQVKENYDYNSKWVRGLGVGVGWDDEVIKPPFDPEWTPAVVDHQT